MEREDDWLNVFKFQFLRKILIKISDLYYFASGFDNDDPRSGRTRLRSPYNRVQNLVKEKEKQEELKKLELKKAELELAKKKEAEEKFLKNIATALVFIFGETCNIQ